jgi:hypothetical protein
MKRNNARLLLGLLAAATAIGTALSLMRRHRSAGAGAGLAGRDRSPSPPDRTSAEASPDLLQLLRRQINLVDRGLFELGQRAGEPGSETWLAVEQQRLRDKRDALAVRLLEAEADLAGISFPSPDVVNELARATGELEAAVARGTALGELVQRISAVIDAYS